MLASALLAMLVTALCVPSAKRLAHSCGAIDVPRDGRRMHTVPVPRLGGIAVAASVFICAPLVILMYKTLKPASEAGFEKIVPTIAALFFGGTIILVTGVCDDIAGLRPLLKLAGELAAAVAAVLCGAVINRVCIGGEYYSLGIFSVPLTLLWIVLLTNAFNLLDGLDGLAAGVAAICGASLSLISMLYSDFFGALLLATLAGAAAGFLPSNIAPASIFMGDTGALLLGYSMALASISEMLKAHALISLLIPAIIFGLPIFDTLFAFSRRLLKGKSPFAADNSHIHHRLCKIGLSGRRTVGVLYVITAVLGIAAVLYTAYPLYSLIIILSVAAVMVYINTAYGIIKRQEEATNENQ